MERIISDSTDNGITLIRSHVESIDEQLIEHIAARVTRRVMISVNEILEDIMKELKNEEQDASRSNTCDPL